MWQTSLIERRLIVIIDYSHYRINLQPRCWSHVSVCQLFWNETRQEGHDSAWLLVHLHWRPFTGVHVLCCSNHRRTHRHRLRHRLHRERRSHIYGNTQLGDFLH